MKTNKIIYVLGLTLLIASCAKTEETLPQQGYKAGEMVFHAYNADEAETKTSLQSDGSIYWSATEDINLFYGSTASAKFTSSNTEEAASVDFTGDLGDITVDADTSFWAVYPYSENNICDGESVTVTLPASQTAVAGTFAEDLFISVAKSQSTDLYFYNVCGGVKFQVPTSGIKSVTFKGTNGEVLAGTAKVKMDSDGKPYIEEITNPQTELTLTPADGGTFSKGKDYYFVAFPTTLKGFEIRYNKSSVSAPFVQEMDVEIKRSTWGTITKNAVSNVFNNYITITCRELENNEDKDDYAYPVIKVYLDKDHTTYELDTLKIGTNKIYGVPYGFSCNGAYHINSYNITSFDFSNWDASLVTNASYMFQDCAGLTSAPDLSCLKNVVNARYMFNSADHRGSVASEWFADLDLSPLTKVEDASYMFYYCLYMKTPPDISAMTSIKDASNMFAECEKMRTPPDLSTMSSLTNASNMFYGCEYMTTPPDMSGLSSLTNAHNMFYECKLMKTAPDLTKLTSLTDASYMFYRCYYMTAPPDLSNLTSLKNASNMFAQCQRMETTPNLSHLSALTDASYMFDCCSKMTTPPDLTKLSALTNAAYMFWWSGITTPPDLSGLASLTNAEGMFACCEQMTTAPDLSPLTALTDGSSMFENCSSLTIAPDLSNLTSLVKANSMFAKCSKIKTPPDLSKLTSLQYASYMFKESAIEETPDLTPFYDNYVSSGKRVYAKKMFEACDSLKVANIGYYHYRALPQTCQIFYDANSLEKVTMTNSDSNSIEAMQYMLEDCFTSKTITQTGPDENGVITFTIE